MLIYKLKFPNIKTSSKLKKPNEVGNHFVRLELVNPRMLHISGSLGFEYDT